MIAIAVKINAYLSRLVYIEKSIYDYVECDSHVERAFAEALEKREDIRLFIKLPRWFKIETPFGTYNPDWAIVKQGEEQRLYLVRETKGTNNILELAASERQKILCGKAHFQELGVDFKVVKSASEL